MFSGKGASNPYDDERGGGGGGGGASIDEHAFVCVCPAWSMITPLLCVPCLALAVRCSVAVRCGAIAAVQLCWQQAGWAWIGALVSTFALFFSGSSCPSARRAFPFLSYLAPRLPATFLLLFFCCCRHARAGRRGMPIAVNGAADGGGGGGFSG